MTQPTRKNWLILFTLGLIWGASFLGVELALEGYAPLTVAALRITLGAVAVAVLAVATGVGFPEVHTATGRRIWLHAAGMGMASNAIPFSLLSWGQQHVTAGFAGITMAGVPLLILPLAHFLVPGEQLTPRKVIGFGLGFVGVVVLIGPQALFDGSSDSLARLACIAAAACYACGSIITRLAPAGPMLSFSAAALLIATVAILPVAILIDGVPGLAQPSAMLGMLYLGIFPTALATLMLVQIIQTAGPSFLGLVNYQVPVWAVILGVAFLSEAVPPQLLTALAMILAGLFVAQARIWRFRP